ncbi:MAG: NTP transferase domain-containing protein, partial [Acidobacteria bacterium]|nr:NTP transferase domain-containing protein [Acidobacteriota bacterium]
MGQAIASDFTGIVVAAGRSARFGGPIPKQFLEIGGRWVVERCVDRLAGAVGVGEVVVVLAPDEMDAEFAARLRAHPGV